MALLEKESILELIENAQASELKIILREMLKSDESIYKVVSELYTERKKAAHSVTINGFKCLAVDAIWVSENITKEELLNFAESLAGVSMLGTGDIQTLAIKSFKSLSKLDNFARMVRVVSILYKGLGAKRSSKIIHGERMTYYKFREEDKYEGVFRTLKDCKEVKDIYDSRRESIKVLRTGKAQDGRRVEASAH